MSIAFRRIDYELDMLKRHIATLKIIKQKEPIGILKISKITGVPFHQVRYSMRMLEHWGFILPSVRGAVTTMKARDFLKNLEDEKKSLIEKIRKMK